MLVLSSDLQPEETNAQKINPRFDPRYLGYVSEVGGKGLCWGRGWSKQLNAELGIMIFAPIYCRSWFSLRRLPWASQTQAPGLASWNGGREGDLCSTLKGGWTCRKHTPEIPVRNITTSVTAWLPPVSTERCGRVGGNCGLRCLAAAVAWPQWLFPCL